jgi:hypothetical protein
MELEPQVSIILSSLALLIDWDSIDHTLQPEP